MSLSHHIITEDLFADRYCQFSSDIRLLTYKLVSFTLKKVRRLPSVIDIGGASLVLSTMSAHVAYSVLMNPTKFTSLRHVPYSNSESKYTR